MDKKRVLYILLLLFLIGDFSYSFLQYYSTPLDGDMAGGIVPAEDVEALFDDPFGLKVLTEGELHPNPNRYFAHLIFRDFYRKVPQLIQKFTDPINSVYLSSAIIKLIVHMGLVYLLSTMICGVRSLSKTKLLLVMALITPLFQAFGYSHYMGIIDKSSTYTFFYALPLFLLLLFFSFFHARHSIGELRFSITTKIFLVALLIVLPFSGPLIPPIILIVGFLLFVYYLKIAFGTDKRFSLIKVLLEVFNIIPRILLLYFIPIGILCLYSLYLGTYNSTYQADLIPLLERYSRLPQGIYLQFTQKLGFPILFLIIGINAFIIRRYYYNEIGKKIISSLKWIVLFSLLYIVLIPLGGYRPYRPNLLRFDTIMPITICLIYIFAASSYFLLYQIKNRRFLYQFGLIAVILVFTISDQSNLNENVCERQGLEAISKSSEAVVVLDLDCKILSWETINNPEDSELNAELLLLWNITKTKKLYYFHED